MWRIAARIAAIVALAAGVGILTWGITSAAMGERLRSPVFAPSFQVLPAEAIGWGAGLLAGGLTALALAAGEPKDDDLPMI